MNDIFIFNKLGETTGVKALILCLLNQGPNTTPPIEKNQTQVLSKRETTLFQNNNNIYTISNCVVK